MPSLLFHQDIHFEVQDTYSWYENKSKGLGEDFILELESAYVAIQKMPLAWPLVTNKIHRFGNAVLSDF